MLAAVFHGPDDLRLEKRPTPSPGPGELLVKVGADTICGTDLRILRGEKTSGVHPGKVLGHEVAGHVVEAGRGVGGYDPGQPVAIAPVIPCGGTSRPDRSKKRPTRSPAAPDAWIWRRSLWLSSKSWIGAMKEPRRAVPMPTSATSAALAASTAVLMAGSASIVASRSAEANNAGACR